MSNLPYTRYSWNLKLAKDKSQWYWISFILNTSVLHCNNHVFKALHGGIPLANAATSKQPNCMVQRFVQHCMCYKHLYLGMTLQDCTFEWNALTELRKNCDTQANYKSTKSANESAQATKYCAQQQKWYMIYCRIWEKRYDLNRPLVR